MAGERDDAAPLRWAVVAGAIVAGLGALVLLGLGAVNVVQAASGGAEPAQLNLVFAATCFVAAAALVAVGAIAAWSAVLLRGPHA